MQKSCKRNAWISFFVPGIFQWKFARQVAWNFTAHRVIIRLNEECDFSLKFRSAKENLWTQTINCQAVHKILQHIERHWTQFSFSAWCEQTVVQLTSDKFVNTCWWAVRKKRAGLQSSITDWRDNILSMTLTYLKFVQGFQAASIQAQF